MIWFILPVAIAILIIAVAAKLIMQERREKGEDDDPWNWRGWSGPQDWPKLPPGPKGSGPPDVIPDEWVWEELGQPPRLIKPLPPKDEV